MKKGFVIIVFYTLLSCCASNSAKNTQLSDDTGKVITVLLDNFFNNEYQDVNGHQVKWHYLWNDTSAGGYSQLGELFKKEGAQLSTLADAPTKYNLKDASIYIIADPDNQKETTNPNFMTETYANTVVDWVKDGGVLVLFANDSSNCELDKFNMLSQKFGITFNKDNRLIVQDPHFEQGEVKVNKDNPIFKTAKNIYIKGICSITAVAPAKVVLKGKEYSVTSVGEVGTMLQLDEFGIIAVSKYGKGTVFALGDPWIYNEYIDHLRLPKSFENYEAATDWVKWLLQNTHISKK